MKHITEEYGMPCNDLELTLDEYHNVIEPFLKALGVRSRTTMYWYEDGTGVCKIQAENVYKACITGNDREFADMLMTEDALSHYKR